jgi:lysophospholipase L1-like esterase
MCCLFQKLLAGIACVAILGAPLSAAALSVHKVSTPPQIRPLSFLSGGRVSVTPSASPNHFGGKNYTYQWPGSYFRAAFDGTTAFFWVVKGDEILHVVVDGRLAAKLVKPETGVYRIDGLGKGKHRVDIFVATETQAAPNTFGGFAIPPGEQALMPTRRHRQIEFIGDSHTVGYGDLSDTRQCTNAKVWADTDDTKAFGPMTARHYDADYQINAISGRGVVRSYNGAHVDTLPQVYPYVLFDKKQKYQDLAWKPQVIVIALGTNDFSTPLHKVERWKTRGELHADFEATYVKFLQKLRTRNPRAFIIVWATDIGGGEIEAEVQKVVRQFKKQGGRHITYLPINGLSFSACNSHPSLADEKIISAKLEHLIDADKAWRNH